MYKIGSFSKLVNVPVKTLRFYDEIGLFKPIQVDLFTGFRYYSEKQVDDINIILELKDIGFSLEEIKQNWNNFSDYVMLKKKTELMNEVNNINKKIKKLDNLRTKIINNKIVFHKENKSQNKDIKVKKID